MAAYEGYPEIKGKTFLKIAWGLHDLILLPSILQTIEIYTDIVIEPPQFVMALLAPFVAAMILAEMTFLTYIVSAALIVGTIYCLLREKQAGQPILSDSIQFSLFLILCILGLLSSRLFFDGAMGV